MERGVTNRQREVLQLFAAGLSAKEVAVELKIHEAGVLNQVYRARAKLTGLARRPVRSREEAVLVARELGLIE